MNSIDSFFKVSLHKSASPSQGSVYQKSNATAEILNRERDAYWQKLEREEAQQKQEEARRKKEEKAREERERREREQREVTFSSVFAFWSEEINERCMP